MKVVINTQYGGFGLSKEGLHEYKKRADINDDSFWYYDIPRDCPHLIAMVEEYGDEIDGDYADLKVVEIPDDVNWYIEEYDGREWVAERHRTWHG